MVLKEMGDAGLKTLQLEAATSFASLKYLTVDPDHLVLTVNALRDSFLLSQWHARRAALVFLQVGDLVQHSSHTALSAGLLASPFNDPFCRAVSFIDRARGPETGGRKARSSARRVHHSLRNDQRYFIVSVVLLI